MTIKHIRSFLFAAILLAQMAGGTAVPAECPVLSEPYPAPAALPMAEQALAGVSLSPAQVTVEAGATFTLEVLANCGTHADAAAVQVRFDPVYMEVVSVAQDTASFPDVLRNSFDNASGVAYYDAGSLSCHSQGSCPAGVIRLATITLRAKAGTFPSRNVDIFGQITWSGDLVFDGQGSGSTITIPAAATPIYLPLLSRGWVR